MSKAIDDIGRGLLFIGASFLFGGAVSTFFRAIGVNVILGGVARALTPTPKRPITSVKATVTGGTNPMQLVFGTRRVGGQLAYIGTSGTGNAYLHYVQAHSLCASCGVDDITDVYFDGITVADANINGSGVITAGTYAGWAEVRRVLGTSADTVDATLDAAFTEIDSNFIGKGVAKTYFRFYRDTADDDGFQAVFPRGVPVCTVLLKGQKCYDPRLDSTNGGSGTHRYATASTWAYSSNPALCASQFAIMDKGDGGCGLDPATEVDWVSVAAAASICEETRTIPDGLGGNTTQVRFDCHIVLNTSDDLTTNLDKLVASMAGQWVITGGRLTLYAGAYTSPVATIDEAWLAGHPTYTPRMPIEALWNAVKGSFDNASAGYRTEYATPYTNTTYETQDDGQRLWKDVQHYGTTNQYQAQYLQVIFGRRSRMQKQLGLPLNMRGRDLRVWDTVTVTLDEFNLSQVFRIVDLDNQPDGCMATLVEEASSVYSDALTDYVETNAPSTPTVTEETPPTPAGVGVNATIAGNIITWTAGPSDIVAEVHASDTSGGTFINIGETQGTSYTERVSGGATRYYKVRFRIRGTVGSFSSEVSATGLTLSEIPEYMSSGTADSDTDDGAGSFLLQVGLPSGTAAGDLLILQVGAQAGAALDGVTIDTPSGWTLHDKEDSASGRESQALFYLRYTGASPTLDVTGDFTSGGTPTTGITNVAIAQVHRFTAAVASGSPFDGAAQAASAASTTIIPVDITTTVNNTLCCQFVYLAEDETTASFTTEVGVDYVEVATSATTAGGDIAIQLQTGEKATAGGITGGSYTIGTSQISIKHGFGLKPVT